MLLNAWLLQSEWSGKFVWTSIQVNKSFASARHRDGGNAGPSLVRALGRFDGGNLLVWPDDTGAGPVGALSYREAVELDVRRWQWIDGCKAHETTPFSGERISVVFFTVANWNRASDQTMQLLRQLGTALPKER